MKIAVLIPDRGDRPKFLANCMRMLKAQTLQPDIIEIVNDPPVSQEKDITWRYRMGYEKLRNKRIDVIVLWENDDWYDPKYIETMVSQWKDNGRPDIFGLNYTIYYHIQLLKYHKMGHYTRASAMNTLIRPDLVFPWCADNEPYTDIHLWKHLKGITIDPGKHICLGIKHGEGFCGGAFHSTMLHKYANNDPNLNFLRSFMDSESILFYTNYFKN